MENIFDKALVQIKPSTYLKLLLIIAPLLNFLSGINIDLFAPSLPAISHYYNTSFMLAKNTITVGMIGFGIGCIVFGPVIDAIGRRRTIMLGLLLYVFASILALACKSIEQLMIIRFIQGMMVSTVSVGCRALIADSFTGKRFNIALVYASVAYGLGPILGPFIGGLLQYHFGWQANFLAYTLFSLILFMLVLLFVNESIQKRQSISPKATVRNYLLVLKHGRFIAGTALLACGQFIIMVYPTVGAFIVEKVLGGTAITYGYSALIISCGYLLGTLTNRIYIKHFQVKSLIQFGLIFLVIALLIQIFFVLTMKISLLTVILPIGLMGFALGFIFSNILGMSLKIFPHNTGVASATVISLCMVIAALGVFLISHINVNSLKILTAIFAVTITSQIFIYFIFIHKPFIAKHEGNLKEKF